MTTPFHVVSMHLEHISFPSALKCVKELCLFNWYYCSCLSLQIYITCPGSKGFFGFSSTKNILFHIPSPSLFDTISLKKSTTFKTFPFSCLPIPLIPSVFFSNFILVSLFLYRFRGNYSHNPFAVCFTKPFGSPSQPSRYVVIKHPSFSDLSLSVFSSAVTAWASFPPVPSQQYHDLPDSHSVHLVLWHFFILRYLLPTPSLAFPLYHNHCFSLRFGQDSSVFLAKWLYFCNSFDHFHIFSLPSHFYLFSSTFFSQFLLLSTPN